MLLLLSFHEFGDTDHLAKTVNIVHLLPLILSPISTTDELYLIAKRLLLVGLGWLLRREKLHLLRTECRLQ